MLIVCQKNDEEVRSGAIQTLGYATLVVARELKKRIARARRDRPEHEHGGRGHAVLERHDQENVVGIGACFGSGASTAAYEAMHHTTVDSSTADHCWWIFLHVNLAMVLLVVFSLYMHQRSSSTEDA